MPFNTDNLPIYQFANREHYWVLRIAIDPSALRKDQINHIDTIKQILRETLGDNACSAKIYEITDDNDFSKDYDAALSTEPKDRTEVGKEVCIYFPDAGAEDQLSAASYKSLMLTLWQKLQAKNIPLHYATPQGDVGVNGPNSWPTPFSFTADSTAINSDGEEVKDWQVKHGCLFKNFNPSDARHPLQDVEFTERDLQEAGIAYDSTAVALDYQTQANSHKTSITQSLQEAITDIQAKGDFYTDVLDSDDTARQLKTLLTEYEKGFLSAENKGDFQVNFRTNQVANNAILQRIQKSYPHNSDKDFTAHGPAKSISTNEFIKRELNQIDGIIATLKTDYLKRIADITTDFLQHLPGTVAEDQMTVNWADYFGNDGDTDISDTIRGLIAKDPAGMQRLYRRIIILEQEKQTHEAFVENQPTTPINVVPFSNFNFHAACANALTGIERYQARSRSIFSTHLGIFSRIFDNSRGRVRADIYHTALTNDAYTTLQRATALYSLLASSKGKTLQGDVANTILGDGTRNVAGARDKIKSYIYEHIAQSEETERDELKSNINTEIEGIVNFANGSPKEPATLPNSIWTISSPRR